MLPCSSCSSVFCPRLPVARVVDQDAQRFALRLLDCDVLAQAQPQQRAWRPHELSLQQPPHISHRQPRRTGRRPSTGWLHPPPSIWRSVLYNLLIPPPPPHTHCRPTPQTPSRHRQSRLSAQSLSLTTRRATRTTSWPGNASLARCVVVVALLLRITPPGVLSLLTTRPPHPASRR